MMNFSFSALLGSIMLMVATIGSWGHHSQRSTPTSISWSATSVPLGTIYRVSTSSDETASPYSFKANNILPAFTFAKDTSPSNETPAHSSSKNISTINSYLRASDTKTPTPLFNVRLSTEERGATSSNNEGGISETMTQQALRLYGNSVGSIVRAQEVAHPNANTDITLFLKDPNDVAAIPVIKIGDDLIQAGKTLTAMNAVPNEALQMHQALANTYQDAGEKLRAIAALRKTADIADAIEIYNQSTQKAGTAFVAVVLMFKDQQVRFSPSEAGSIFVFSGSF